MVMSPLQCSTNFLMVSTRILLDNLSPTFVSLGLTYVLGSAVYRDSQYERGVYPTYPMHWDSCLPDGSGGCRAGQEAGENARYVDCLLYTSDAADE